MHRSAFSHVPRLFLLLLIMSAPIMAQQATTYSAAGSAYDIETNQLLYRELYTTLDDNREVSVEYVSPEGKLFAKKQLSYLAEPFQPNVFFTDLRTQHTWSAEFKNARLIQLSSLAGANEKSVIMDHANTVVDIGYDAYVQLHWDELLSGKKLSFDFALPEQLSRTQLSVQMIKPTSSPLYDKNIGQHWIYFRLTPAKKLRSIFTDPVFLAYDPNGRYLMRYQGRSAINDDQGIAVSVRIEYDYAE